MIKRFFILLLAIVASVGMSFAQASIVSSGTKGGMSYTFYDNGLLEISGSGALPGSAFTNWDGGFGTSVKNIRFAEDCEVYGLDYMWFACYTENSQLETVEINSVAPIMFSGTSGAGIFYRQDGAVTLTITAPGIVDAENQIIDNYGSPVNMIFNMPATTVFERKWFSGLENNFAVTIPTGAKGHIPAGYSFTDPYDQKDYDDMVAHGHEDLFWESHSHLVEGVNYTNGVESTFVITAENASQIFGKATVSFQAPTEASNSEWVLWRKSDLKEFPDMSPGNQKVCKDVTVKVNNGVYNTDSGWGIHFESLAEDGVQFVAPEGKVFKRIVILNEYGTFSDPNWSYDKNYKRWSGSADTVGFVGNICGISLIEFELGDSAPATPAVDAKLPGKFSVSASQVVYFSRGNLQYQASTNTWRFAENQYDAVGGSNGSNNAAPYNTSSANHSPSASQTGWIDLFGWAASGITRTGVTAYQPYSTSTNNADYGTTTTKSASETLGNYDWGKNMGDGWRTLTAEEWGYLIGPGIGGTTPSEYRDHYHSLRGLCKITVSGTDYPGLMILPDDMYNNLPTEGDIASKWSACAVAATSMNYTKATFTEAEWTALQAAGAVFLPAAGYRYTTVNYAGAYGDYWSSSASSDKLAFFLRFYAGYLTPENSGNRYNGRSVRLVSDIAPDPAPAGPIPCTAADLGKVLCTDGSIYATVSEASAANKTAAAVIAYVDTQNGKALALALADDGGEMDWATAKTTAPAHTPAVSGGTWTLASKDDWNNMITAAGGYEALRDGFSGVGGTNMQQDAYWSSTPENDLAWIFYFAYGGKWVDGYVDDPSYVRACLAFDIPAAPAAPAYETVMNLINEIPNPVELTAECKAKIDAARAAFIALSDGDKDLITNIATLTTAEAAFDNVMDIWLIGDCDVILWSDTTLTVRKHAGEGNGAMADYNYMSRAPWYSSHWYDPKPNDIVIKSVTIEEGVTHLGDYAFAWMSEMKTVTIPSSVTTIPEDAFYWSKAVDDIYLHTNPSDLIWVLPTSADNQFKPEKGTLCHVPVDLLPAYQEWLNGLNVTYVGDQTPTIPTLEVGLTLNAMDVFYLGPDTTCFQFNCFSSNKYFFGKGSFRIKFESPAENVHTMLFQPKQQGKDVMMMYRDGETFVTYGTNCCATALPTSATVTAGDGTKANPFVLEPDTKGECVQAEWTTLPQAVSEITYNGEPHTLVAAGVSNYGTVQYSLDNGASWSVDLPQGTDPVTYTIHYRVIGGNACIQGIDYDPNNKVTASIVSPAVENVEAKIAAIPQPVVYTPACEEAIADARSAYDALDDDLKPFVENYDVLTAAETTYANLKDIAVVEAKINNIPTSVELKLATRDSIESARAAYEALNADQKPLVTNYQTLLDAEAALAALNPGGSAPVDIVWDGNTGIASVDPNTTSPAYEGMTVTVGNGSSFSTYQSRLYFTFYSQPNGGYIFANADGSNITKVVIESTTALTSTMTEVDRMGSGWVISNENKTATWTGNADSVSIWEGQSFTNYWVVDKITFTVNGVGATPLDQAQAVKDLIDAIPVPVTLDSKDEIDAARDAYDALADLTKGALDEATVKKLTDAEDAYAALIKEATDVIALINAIPQPVVYNEACGDSIIAARNAYDALSDELKPLVTNYSVLTDAEATYEALAPRIWTSGDCQVIYWPGDSAMIVSKLPGEGNGVMDNYANKNSVPWVDYQLKVKTLTIESGVTEIGSCAFYELRNLEGGLVIPEGVTAIHENGFRNCLKLTSITLPSTITLLGDDADAFNNCKAANISITADPNKLAWNDDFDDFIYSYSQQDVHKTTVCHVPVDFYEIYVAKFDQTVNVTFVGDLPAALSPAEHAAIEAVKDSIAAIGAEISYPESGAAIDAARSAYDALDDDLKPFVSNYQTLLDAEDAYADAKQAHDAVAAAVVDKINAIPVPVEYSSKAAIDTARVAYDALLDTQKALITPEQLKVLTDAEAAWAAIAEKVEHNVSYMGKDGELKNEKVALLHIPDPAPDFNGYEFVRWDVKAGDFLEEGLRIKAIYTPIITTNPQGFDTLAYNGLAQELVKAGVAKEGHIEYSLYPEESESWSAELPKATIAGVYAIYYKLVREGHADYIAPEPTMATIAKVPVTYVAPIAYDTLVYTAANQTLIAAGQTQDGTFEYSLDPNLLDSWKAELPQAKDAGTYSVYYRVQGDLNHLDSVAATPVAVTIAKAPLTATADDKSIIYGDLAPEFTVTYAGWQGDDDATVLTGEIAYACEYVKGNPVGEYVITPSGVDAANYTITFVNGKLTVNSKSAKSDDITAKQADNEKLVYDAAANKPTIQAKDTTKTLVEDTDYKLTFIGRGDTEYAESATAPAHVGEYTAIVAFIGNYTDTLTVDFVINKAPLTITADDKEVTFGEFAPEFTVSYEGWQGNDTATVLTGSQAYACEYVRGNKIGDYTIIPSGVDAHDYAITFVNGTLTVNRKSAKSADITAKQADNEKLVYDAEANRPTIQVKDTTLVLTEAQDYVLTFMGVAADQTPYAESETAPTHVGNYKAIVAFIGNYIDTLTVDFTINKAPLTITANDTAMIYGDVAPAFTVSYNGWFGNDDESVILGTQAYDCVYAPGSPIGTYAITPKGVDAYDYAITFVDGTLTVNKAHVYVSDAEAQIAKFADGHANAVVLEQGVLNGIKLNDPIAHVTTAAFSSADVAENLTITLFYELTGDAALLNNYNLDPTSDIFTTEGVIIEPFIPDNEEKPEDEEAKVNEGIEIYAYGYCDGSGYSLKYHLESGNPDQYKIDFEDSRFTDVDWTNLVIIGKDGTIDIEIPVDMPTGDYTMTVYFRDSRFDWLESRQFNVTFHVNLPETYVRPLFDNVIALVDTCHCLTDIQWYWRANSSELWQPIEGANGYYYHVDGKLTGEYFVSAKMNGEPTYTCGQTDMETLYGAGQQLEAPVVRAYPNPVVNSTTVTIENSIEWIHNIRIVNLMGVEVMNDTFEGNETNVEMSAYPQGNYMISVDGIVVKVMKK